MRQGGQSWALSTEPLTGLWPSWGVGWGPQCGVGWNQPEPERERLGNKTKDPGARNTRELRILTSSAQL